MVLAGDAVGQPLSNQRGVWTIRIAFAFLTALMASPLASCTQPAPLLDADASDMIVAPEEPITLTATASGGQPPYLFRWSVEVQPDNAEIAFNGDVADGAGGSVCSIRPVATSFACG